MVTRNRLAAAFNKLRKNRFSAWYALFGLYLTLSFFTRIVFLFWSAKNIDFNFYALFRAFITGLGYDIVTALSILLLYSFYLLLFPKRWIGSLADRIFTYCQLSLVLIFYLFYLDGGISFLG